MSAGKRNLWIILTLTALGLAIHVWFGTTRYSCSTSSSCSYTTTVKGQQEGKQLYANRTYPQSSSTSKRKYQCKSKFPTSEAPYVDEFVKVDQQPQPKNLVNFKKEIHDLGHAGKAIIRILVDEQGNYLKHKVLKGEDSSYSRAIENRLGALQFRPAIRNHQPVKCWVNIIF